MRRPDVPPRAPSAPPPSEPRSRVLATVLEYGKLREIRETLARGRVVARDQRTPQEHVRMTLFRTAQELLRFLGEFARLTDGGGRFQIVEREHVTEAKCLVIEFVIVEAKP